MQTNRQMKIPNRLPLIIITAIMSLATAAAQQHGKFPKHEVRAVWLTTLSGLDWPRTSATGASSIRQQQQELCDILDKLHAAGINTVLFQARIRATTVYPSAIEPWDACLTGTPGRPPGYDPLAFATDECHKRGMEIQAWVVTVPIGKWGSAGCQSLRKKHPGLAVRIGDEGYIDPANPAAAGYIASICREITSRYDIDGIHLDYIRYPESWPTGGITARSRRTARRRTSSIKNTTLAERQRNITAIVRSVHDAIKRQKPWVKLSCATIGKHSDLARYSSRGWNALVKGCQDTQEWLRTGIVDQLYPMMYFSGDNFYPFAFGWRENSQGRTIVPGIGTYRLSRREGDWPVDEVKRQMSVSRAAGMGFAMFRERFFSNNTKGIYAYTKDIFAPYPALIPPMKWAKADRPGTPGNLKTACAEDYITATWDSIPPLPGGTAYNIYASSTYPVDTGDPRNLIAVRRKGNSITMKTPRQLYIAVTATDRYGNESEPLQQEPPALSTATASRLLACDGRHLAIPGTGNQLDAEYILLKDLAGRAVATRPYRPAHIDVSRVPEGCYAVYSLNAKGAIHRLGFAIIKREKD